MDLNPMLLSILHCFENKLHGALTAQLGSVVYIKLPLVSIITLAINRDVSLTPKLLNARKTWCAPTGIALSHISCFFWEAKRNGMSFPSLMLREFSGIYSFPSQCWNWSMSLIFFFPDKQGNKNQNQVITNTVAQKNLVFWHVLGGRFAWRWLHPQSGHNQHKAPGTSSW